MKLNVFTKLFGLVFLACGVMFFAACSDDDDKVEVDTALNGTWIDDDDEIELVLNNGNFVYSDEAKGTYTTSGGKVTIVITHVGFSGNWFTKTELKESFGSISDETLNGMFATQTTSYSVNGNKLNMTLFGEAASFTKQ
ncbi:MAG: hypothetical protein FWF51_07870 [Chitinivibrionia bacterium]|nr:hypothetical protein [Chitinivibrionia bacterium]